ncbi:unnamed protein product, partial [Ectocarpus fasciculatus]
DDGACEFDESCTPGADGYTCSPAPNSCLDPENSLYGCGAGTTKIDLTDCGIGEEDLEDLVECFNAVGRASVTTIRLRSSAFTTLPAGLFDGFDNLERLHISDNLL